MDDVALRDLVGSPPERAVVVPPRLRLGLRVLGPLVAAVLAALAALGAVELAEHGVAAPVAATAAP